MNNGQGISAAAAQEDIEVDPYDAIHIVGRWQDVLGRVLRMKVPRALCGESLEEDPDRPGLTVTALIESPRVCSPKFPT